MSKNSRKLPRLLAPCQCCFQAGQQRRKKKKKLMLLLCPEKNFDTHVIRMCAVFPDRFHGEMEENKKVSGAPFLSPLLLSQDQISCFYEKKRVWKMHSMCVFRKGEKTSLCAVHFFEISKSLRADKKSFFEVTCCQKLSRPSIEGKSSSSYQEKKENRVQSPFFRYVILCIAFFSPISFTGVIDLLKISTRVLPDEDVRRHKKGRNGGYVYVWWIESQHNSLVVQLSFEIATPRFDNVPSLSILVFCF